MRYIFEKYRSTRSKHLCPKCGRRSFVRFVNEETLEPLADNVGKCDHINSCGYIYTPKDYFRDNPPQKKAKAYNNNGLKRYTNKSYLAENKPKESLSEPPQEDNYISRESLLEALKNAPQSMLYKGLCKLFPEKKVSACFTLYNVGSTHNNNTVFYQVDTEGNVRCGKVFRYGENLHRMGNSFFIKGDKDKPITQCFFGEHLLKQLTDTDTINIVESEKTALVCHLYYGGVWLATGGCGNLHKEWFKVFTKARKTSLIRLFPDKGCYDKWYAKGAEISRRLGLNMSFSKEIESAKYSYLPDNTDLADIILENKAKEQ